MKYTESGKPFILIVYANLIESNNLLILYTHKS